MPRKPDFCMFCGETPCVCNKTAKQQRSARAKKTAERVGPPTMSRKEQYNALVPNLSRFKTVRPELDEDARAIQALKDAGLLDKQHPNIVDDEVKLAAQKWKNRGIGT